MKLKENFPRSTFQDDNIIKQISNYYPKINDKELGSIIDIIERTDPVKTTFNDNLSKVERNSLEGLCLDDEVIFKKADKANALIIMDKTLYKDKIIYFSIL